jgi:hypothetical protein
MFYKLLVENSRDYHNYRVESATIQFVEPDNGGKIINLPLDFNDDDIAQFKKLINAVWTRIINLDLPDISNYDASYKGVLAFENDLINDHD